jgi:hypothetical protein
MKTFSQFYCEAYDAAVMSGSQIRRSGEGGRVGTVRKKSTPEIRRTKRLAGGQSRPSSYKPRADIGTQRSTSDRVQQPTQERGSAREKQLSAAKAERAAAARARVAAKKTGTSVPTAAKPKELEKQATKLLTKKAAPKAKTPAKDERFSSSRKPEEHMVKGKYTKDEKKKLVRAGKRLHRDLAKGVDKPTSHYQP